ncbi:hypothetical protein [Halomarina oriensis]|uniref:Uncharacterized protein n=1 Tax=Halomarina oriensis TaxID=671145 RepID=A0A6B0GQ54_9EURY|nr:hypothetical protein [Halomarina oriensis]MWG34793.1 hypothetical protein [Halomarina oriensis]
MTGTRSTLVVAALAGVIGGFAAVCLFITWMVLAGISQRQATVEQVQENIERELRQGVW